MIHVRRCKEVGGTKKEDGVWSRRELLVDYAQFVNLLARAAFSPCGVRLLEELIP